MNCSNGIRLVCRQPAHFHSIGAESKNGRMTPSYNPVGDCKPRRPMSDTDQRQEQEPQSPVPAPRVLGELAADLRSLTETTRLRVARALNAELVMLYWEIGSRIR
jgi:hypothetical protein